MDIAALEVRVTDCVALGQCHRRDGRGQVEGALPGQPIDERVLLTDVWVREDGRWQVVRRHSSPVPAGQNRLKTRPFLRR